MSRGGFFAVDRRSWAAVCQPGMNCAATYLVLASGSAYDNHTTAWSVRAVERYTSISRHKAKAAVKTLVDTGVLATRRAGTRPQYELVPWPDTPNARPKRKPMSVRQRGVYEKVLAGEQLVKGDGQVASALAKNGRLTKEDTGAFRAVVDTPEWIWLPNSLVIGVSGETPPVELVRQTQDVMTLRLLVDLYQGQHLRDDGGIGREHTYQEFERFEVGQWAQYTVWGFRYSGTAYVPWTELTEPHSRDKLTRDEREAGQNRGIDFFRRQGQLADLGLIDWVPHMFESGQPDAVMIHPLPMSESTDLETRISHAAHRAGEALLTEGQRDWASSEGLRLVPVPRHIANVQVIGIARLRYRPQTRATAVWWANLTTQGESFVDTYDALATEVGAGLARRTSARALHP